MYKSVIDFNFKIHKINLKQHSVATILVFNTTKLFESWMISTKKGERGISITHLLNSYTYNNIHITY